VNDGSTDGTTDLLPELGVPFVEFPRRLGVGNAMRAGLRYAVRHGYRAVVRVDGDGQHRPDDVARVAARVLAGDVDLVLGTRFAGAAGQERDPGAVRARAAALRRLLGAWLAFRTGTHASDPTSGLYAIGPHALRVLADHHPTGYPEPELRLFAHRNHLATVELGVRPRARFGGRTSLTPIRVVGAAARVALALVVVPWRTRLSGPR
jgi:glycosyltransferase involved in cell wall biosynthesis